MYQRIIWIASIAITLRESRIQVKAAFKNFDAGDVSDISKSAMKDVLIIRTRTVTLFAC
jgi:hypothetical protein